MGKYFGTDGFRGEAGITLTADHAYKVGRFLGWDYNALRERNGNNEPARIVIGKDTRRSSYMFEYIRTGGLCIDDVGVCAQRIEHRFSDVPGTAIGAVQANLDTLEGIDTKADQVAHIAVAACHIVHSAADVFPVGKGQLRPVLIERMEFSVDVILD